MSKSYIALGNQALRAKDYETALSHYRHAQQAYPQLAPILKANIALAEQRLKKTAGKEDNAVIAQVNTAIDIVVPVFNALEDVQRCLASLEKHTDGFNVRIIVVNDGSDDVTTQWLRERCNRNPVFMLIEHPENFGYTKAVNAGLKASTAPYVITQNSDTIVMAGWLCGLVRCMESDPKIGIVGPLSNAASWQNVPVLRDESGGFAVNELPPGYDVDSFARLVAEVSVQSYPRIPFVNGFCFMIRRAVIDTIGYMDEENFPVGYGEENDYCIRAADAGFEMAIADDVFVFHAKSKSFGHERRKDLSAQGTVNLKRKHTEQKYLALVKDAKRSEQLDAVRKRIQQSLSKWNNDKPIDLMTMRILFLLPVKGGGGGAHSVVQEVSEMRRLGLHARVGVKHEHIEGFLKDYADIPAVEELFVVFDDANLLMIAQDYDIVVGTIYSSMRLVRRIVDALPHILPAYYVQDYEPLFFDEGSSQWNEARDSYNLVANACLFAKTQWIIDEVQRHHGVTVHKVQPSIDHEVYRPTRRADDGCIHVTAMIRPQTPRRGAGRTMRLLKRLHQAHGDRLVIHIFGCDSGQPEFLQLERDFLFQNHGRLTRPEVAALLAHSDLFIDLSDYQAFGRTALEAMACACVAVVPKMGGACEYAQHNVNSLVLDTNDEESCFHDISELLLNSDSMRRLRLAGLATAARYSVHAAAVSECLILEESLRRWRKRNPEPARPKLFLMPSTRPDNIPTGSGYVRVILPYQAPAIIQQWHVSQVRHLPAPGSGSVVLIQRDANRHSIQELLEWLPHWRAAGGKLLYEIDDDLLDIEALRDCIPNGDLQLIAEKVRYLASQADVIHVSTEPLAERLRPLNPRIRVVPNVLDVDLWQLDRPRQHDQGPYRRLADGPIRIGYIGTATHDEDLALVADAMRALEKRYGSAIDIEIIGAFQNKTPMFGKRVGLPKKNDYPSFVRWLLQRVHWDIGIIPLANSHLNKSKSYLKFLEYAALDMAIVVSDADAYKPVARDGENCLVVGDQTQDWVVALETLIKNSELRARLTSRARQDLLQHVIREFVILTEKRAPQNFL